MHTGQAFEVAQACRVYVDAAQAFPVSLDIPDARPGAVETLGAAAQSAAEVKVFEGALEHHAAGFLSISLCQSAIDRPSSAKQYLGQGSAIGMTV
ncbi:hypothetical protein D3C78_1608940 [compost metagenome]